MKKIIIIILLLALLTSCNSNNELQETKITEEVNTWSTEIVENITGSWSEELEDKEKIKSNELKEKIKDAIKKNEWEWFLSYNMDVFEKDINTKVKGEWMDAFGEYWIIPVLSKNKDFNRKWIENFFNVLKKRDLNLAKNIFDKNMVSIKLNQEINNIIPTITYVGWFDRFISTEIYKNGILWLSVWWNWESTFHFNYISTYDNNVYRLEIYSNFGISYNENFIFSYKEKEIKKFKDIEEWIKYMIDLFNWKEKNEAFDNELKLFKTKIDLLYKN